MCVSLPGRVLSVRHVDDAPMALVDFGGSIVEISLLFVPEAGPGDAIVAHSGYAVRVAEEAGSMRREPVS